MTVLSLLKHNDLKQHEKLISNSDAENSATSTATCITEKQKRCLGFLFTFCVCLTLVVLVFILGTMFGVQYADYLQNDKPQKFDEPKAEPLRTDFNTVQVKSDYYSKINLKNRLPKPKPDEPYSAIIEPISANFAKPTILEQNSNSSSEGLLDFYRKIEISVRLTLHELVSQMEHWREDIFTCKYVVAQICSPESVKTVVRTQLDSFNRFKRIFWTAAHSTKKINETEIYEKIDEAKRFLTDIETKQVDLCENNEDTDCRRCMRRKADDYYTNGLWCKTFREWHVIRYKPKVVRFCT